MILAALLVPATIWWMSLRYYTRQQAEKVAALEKVERQSAEAKRHKTLVSPLDSSSIEFARANFVRSAWHGQTDPDSVWHDQRREANQTLMQHGLPALKGPGFAPDSPALPRSLRFDRQK